MKSKRAIEYIKNIDWSMSDPLYCAFKLVKIVEDDDKKRAREALIRSMDTNPKELYNEKLLDLFLTIYDEIE